MFFYSHVELPRLLELAIVLLQKIHRSAGVSYT